MVEEKNEIIARLDALIKLTAVNLLQGKDLKEQVRLLSSIGFQPIEIAELSGQNYNTIKSTLFRIRGEKGKTKAKS